MSRALASLYLSLEDLLTPLGKRFGSPEAVEYLCHRYGWTLALDDTTFGRVDKALAFKGPLDEFLTVASAIRQHLASSDSATPDPQSLAKLITSATSLIDAIVRLKSLSVSDLVAPLSDESFWASIAEHLLDDLLEEYLRVYQPQFYLPLRVGGVIRYEPMSPTEAFRRPYTRITFDWAQLGQLLTNPLDALKSAYHWGGAGGVPFAHKQFLESLAAVLRAVHVSSRKFAPGAHQASSKLIEGSSYSIATAEDALQITLLDGFSPRDQVVYQLGMELYPAKAGAEVEPSGLLLRPVARGGAGGELPLTRNLTLRWKTAAAADDVVGLAIFPDKLDVLHGALAIGASVEIQRPTKDPVYLLGDAGSARVELAGPSLKLSVSGTVEDPESTLVLSTRAADGGPGCKAVLPLDEADSFVGEIVPKRALELSFSPELIWSSTSGFTFNGHARLDITLPTSISIGPIKLTAISLYLGSDPQNSKSSQLRVGASLTGKLGPVTFVVDNIGAAWTVTPYQRQDIVSRPAGSRAPRLGSLDIDTSFAPPKGIGLSIDATAVVGAGYLGFDPAKAEYAGSLELLVRGRFGLNVAGLLTTRMSDGSDSYSLLLVGALRFPPIPVGFGFSLNKLGALVGIHRTTDVDALTGALAGGDLDAVLFAGNPAAMASLPDALGKLFPVKEDAYTVGVLAGLSWGRASLAQIDLGFFYDTAAPARIVAIGRLSVERPRITLHLLALGVLDFDRGEMDLQASLVESRILGADLFGDAAIMLRWGQDPSFVLSIGGFHPGYHPPTEFTRRFPPLRRVTIRAHSDESVLRLALQAYLAITSNTVQMGARVDFGVSVSALSVDGMVSFDALIQIDPTLFIDVKVHGSVALKVAGVTIIGAKVVAQLIGPGNWYAAGTATITVLWWDVDFGFETSDDKPAAPALPTIDGAALLAASLIDIRSWGALATTESGLVAVRRPSAPGGALLFHPLDDLTVRQQVVPLGVVVTLMEAGRLEAPRTFEVTVKVGGTPTPMTTEPVWDAFARAKYMDMSEEAKLSTPSFESMVSGVRVVLDQAAAPAPSVNASWSYDEFVWTTDGLQSSTVRSFVPDATAVAYALATSATALAPLRRTGVARYRGPLDGQVRLERGGRP